jgi:ribosomal protein S18 acetylase RimI-like enzyme
MRHYEHLQWGPDRMRLAPWRGDPTIAELAPVLTGRPVAAESVERGLALVAGRGFRGVLTNALAPEEQHAYLSVGFSVHERLHLLTRDLAALPETHRLPRVRRGRRRDRGSVLEVDHAAFDPFWRLDELGMHDAMSATPASRFRVSSGAPVAYAITGRAAARGYLQRLAVHPEHQRQSWGTALVVDSLRWLRRRGATTVVVNTQESNERALALYLGLGFTHQPDGLAVLSYRFAAP